MDKSFKEILLQEIQKQKDLIDRMDFPPNMDMHGNGLMTTIRFERLELLEKLLEYEP